jgi:VanZ family protein
MAWLWRWGPALVYMAAIFVVSGVANLGPLPANTSDKVGHFAAYSLLGWLLLRAFAGAAWSGYSGRAGLYAWGASSVYAMTDEFHQRFVAGRSADVRDWVADVLGAALGVAVTLTVVAWLRPGEAKEREV